MIWIIVALTGALLLPLGVIRYMRKVRGGDAEKSEDIIAALIVPWMGS